MQDKNSLIGMLLIFVLLFTFMQLNKPSEAELQRQKHIQDSIALAKQRIETGTTETATTPALAPTYTGNAKADSLLKTQLGGKFGAFASSAIGTEQTQTLENEVFKITFTNKGGRIKDVLLKNYLKVVKGTDGKETKVPLSLLEDTKNKFEYYLPVQGVGTVSTADLFFAPTVAGNTISFRADAGEGKFIEQNYTIKPNAYDIDYSVRFEGLANTISAESNQIKLFWENYLDRLELGVDYERTMATLAFKKAEDSPSECSCTKSDMQQLGAPVKWIAATNQFFNTSLVAGQSFSSATLHTEVPSDKTAADLKKLSAELYVPFGHTSSEKFAMKIYSGPNEFSRLREYGVGLEDIVPFGSSIFGSVNRWIIRPIFNFLSMFIGIKGLVILLLTLLVKAFLYPLTYRMLYSQSKMGALKPKVDKLREKYGDDQQKISMESMKLYQEFGVNPLGGCMPMVLQMPIWIALYRFFPAAIEFRQQSFLWASDLTAFDAFIQLPVAIPLFGDHISLFTLLWTVTTLIYTYYSMQNVDMSANPAMKYMQYFMPVMMMFAFNSYASGLTCYLVFSNILNIAQTLITKNYIIDQDKVRAELEANKNKPKKEGGFRARFQKLVEQQQQAQQQQQQQAQQPTLPKKKK